MMNPGNKTNYLNSIIYEQFVLRVLTLIKLFMINPGTKLTKLISLILFLLYLILLKKQIKQI